jgi:hypothetical protein
MQQITKKLEGTSAGSITFLYIIVFIAAGTLYAATCAPAILWQDSALFVYRIWHNDLEGNLGIALSHPLYIIISIAAKYIPAGDLAHKVNLVSAVFGAITIANLFLLLRLWLDKILPALIGAITLTVSWNFWQHSAVAEVYTLFTATVLGELIMLLLYIRTAKKRYLYLLGFLNGLSIANHLLGIFSLSCYIVFTAILLRRRQVRLKHLGTAILLWIIGASPYEYLIIKDIILFGDIQSTLSSAIFGALWKHNVLNTSVSIKMAAEDIILILLNFPTPNFILFFTGLRVLRKTKADRSFANIVLAILVLYFVFAFRYTVPDRYSFFIPFYCIAAVIIGLGADAILNRFNHKMLTAVILAFTLLPAPVYYILPDAAKKIYKPLGQRRQRPYRDEYVYFLQPWKQNYRGAERFADEALNTVEKNAVIYSDTTCAYPLLYVQEVKGERSDVKIVSDYDKSKNAPVFTKNTIAELMKNSAVYVVSPVQGYCPGFLLDNYDFIQKGVLWKVIERK